MMPSWIRTLHHGFVPRKRLGCFANCLNLCSPPLEPSFPPLNDKPAPQEFRNNQHCHANSINDHRPHKFWVSVCNSFSTSGPSDVWQESSLFMVAFVPKPTHCPVDF